jgi:hypothetical protein
MNKAEHAQIARRIGRITDYARIDALWTETGQRIAAHPDECPSCNYGTWEEWEYCAVYHALPSRGVSVVRTGTVPPSNERRLHLLTCPACHVTQRGRDLRRPCLDLEELHQLNAIYRNRRRVLFSRQNILTPCALPDDPLRVGTQHQTGVLPTGYHISKS